jgi:hypothetical protein
MYTRPTQKEKQQYIQLQKWRSLYKHGLLDKFIIDSFVKNNVLFWLLPVDLEKESNEKCLQLCQFIIANGITPRHKSKDIKEKILAYYLSTKRNSIVGKTNGKVYLSDIEILKNYGMSDLFDETPESRSNKMCISLCQFVIKNGNNPNGKSGDKHEKKLAVYLRTKKRALLVKGTAKLYKSDLDILASYNLPDLFKTRGA